MNTIVSRNCANNMNDPTGGYGPRNKLNYFSPFMDIQDPATRLKIIANSLAEKITCSYSSTAS